MSALCGAGKVYQVLWPIIISLLVDKSRFCGTRVFLIELFLFLFPTLSPFLLTMTTNWEGKFRGHVQLCFLLYTLCVNFDKEKLLEIGRPTRRRRTIEEEVQVIERIRDQVGWEGSCSYALHIHTCLCRLPKFVLLLIMEMLEENDGKLVGQGSSSG